MSMNSHLSLKLMILLVSVAGIEPTLITYQITTFYELRSLYNSTSFLKRLQIYNCYFLQSK